MTLGRLAVIGNRTGVGNIFGLNFSGFVAWWLWRTIYLSKLPRLEKKVRVALDWTLDLCFAKDFTCLTAGAPSSDKLLSPIITEPATRHAGSGVSESLTAPAAAKN
jgi:NADH dehydrogenase